MSESNDSAAPEAHPRGRPEYRARVERIVRRADDARSLFLRMEQAPAPKYLPGMFISVTIPLAGGARVRPYTIASSFEDGEPFELLLNRVPDGPGAAWMMSREPGDILSFTGPFGAFTLASAPGIEAVFIAEGAAIAPIRPMIRQALAQGGQAPLRLLHAAGAPDHLFYRDEFAALSVQNPRFEFTAIVVEGDSEALYARLAGETRRRWIEADGDRARRFHICGVGAGVLKLRDMLRAAGYERRSVRYEQW
jgi:ferredoxin-NADP reductase